MRRGAAFVEHAAPFSNRLSKEFIPAGIVKLLAVRSIGYRRIRILLDRALRNSEMNNLRHHCSRESLPLSYH